MRNAATLSVVATLLCLSVVCPSWAIESTWRYTVEDPGKGWARPGPEKGAGWRTGQGGFGKHGTPGGRVKTIWTTPDTHDISDALRMGLLKPSLTPSRSSTQSRWASI